MSLANELRACVIRFGGSRSDASVAEAEKLHRQLDRYAYGPPPIRFTQADVDQARAAGPAVDDWVLSSDELRGLIAHACSASTTWSRRCSVPVLVFSAATGSTRSASTLWRLAQSRRWPAPVL